MPKRDEPEPVEMAISPETVSVIITLARQYDLGEEVMDPDAEEEEVSDIDEVEGAGAGHEDVLAEELREAIEDLNDDEVVDLIALAWVGRGDFDRDGWEEARALARERHRRHSADYLMGMPTLADYLEEGLAALGHAYEPP
jgi:hypothetical protein